MDMTHSNGTHGPSSSTATTQMSSSSSSSSSSFRVRMPWPILVASLCFATFVPYHASVLWSRYWYNQQTGLASSSSSQQVPPPGAPPNAQAYTDPTARAPTMPVLERSWPKPMLPHGKPPPQARYTGNYQPTESSWSQGRVTVHLDGTSPTSPTEEQDEDATIYAEPYQPAGQHLWMDIKDVDPHFLRDTHRLSQAMVQVVEQSNLTLLSYHCHEWILSRGVSCLGVLLESHISIHTWPTARVVALDLFTCGSQSLLPLLPELERLFAIPPSKSEDTSAGAANETAPMIPTVRWTHKKRGYADYYQDGILASGPRRGKTGDSSDAEEFLLGWSAIERAEKTPVLVETTDYQTVEIYGGSTVSSSSSLRTRANKRVFLDGVMQSTLHGLEAYHEILVHPALMSLPRPPQRVAIVGGGEGSTLREVLKHPSVETCVMIDIDGEFVELAQDHLSEWNDCSDIPGAQEEEEQEDDEDDDDEEEEDEEYVSCFENKRAKIYHENAVAWFVDRFSDKDSLKEEEKFDVIIMDALDPSSAVEFSDILYSDEKFVSSLVHALTDDGILVVQVGECDEAEPLVPGREYHPDPTDVLLSKYEKILQDHGMSGMRTYDEGHGQFMGQWEFRLAFKNRQAFSEFFNEPALIDLRLAQRGLKTVSGKKSLDYFDGPTLASIQYPSRAEELQHCVIAHRDASPQCFQPHVMDPDYIPRTTAATSLEDGHEAGSNTSWDAAVQLSMERSSWGIHVVPSVASMVMDQMMAGSVSKKKFRVLSNLFSEFGRTNEYYGRTSYFVDPGAAFTQQQHNREFFDPVLDRRHFLLENPPSLYYT